MLVKKQLYLKALAALAGLGGLVASLSGMSGPAVAAGPQQAGTVYTVLAGFEDAEANGLEVQAFLPQDVTIKVGDTVNWRFTLLEPHTVTFLPPDMERPADFVSLPGGKLGLNPAVFFPSGGQQYSGTGYFNSGFPPPTGEQFVYSLTFTQPGSFPYFCALHPFMTGSVTVLPQDAPPAFPPEVYEDIAESEKQQFISQLPSLDSLPAPVTTLPDGSREHKVLAGIGTQKAELLYFHRPRLTISTGDTVTWSWEMTASPHNVLFIPEGKPVPELVLVEPQPSGPPNIVFNPRAVLFTGDRVFDSTRLVNSGLRLNPVVPAPPSFPVGQFSLKFLEPGTYTYICALHAPQGMVGTITVTGDPVEPPSVGGPAPTPLMVAAAGALGLGFVLAGTALAWRSVRRREPA